METVSLLVLFFFLLFVNFMAEARSRNRTTGCATFTCGNLDFRFPFFDTTMSSRCGLFKMNCSDEIPEIQLEENGEWYTVKSVSQANTITITDPRLNQSLMTGNCSDVSSFSLPNSPWIELTTLYKCNNNNSKNGFTFANCGQGGSSFYNSNNLGDCSAIKIPASWVRNNVTATFPLHIKLPRGCFTCHNRGGECKMIEQGKYICDGAIEGRSPLKLKLILGISSVLAMMILIAIAVMVRATNRRKRDWNGKNIEAVVMLKRFSYVQVKKMTKSFADVLGKGGFGTVYKGKLLDGSRDVAVKLLKESTEDGEEFINELASMSRTSHVNIVSLLGFCYERNKKAIIYEFMPNGSLDKFIAEKMSTKMEWKLLYNIAVGVSHGLEYLHNRCVSRIVHFDIKPQNILMDGVFCPKISDFGLAKLCKNNESIISMLDARGTAGYIAPEVFSKNFGGVSHKSDVYSYGMVVLEMIGARNIERVQNDGSNNTSMYFPDWIYTDLEKGEIMSFLSDQITEEDERIVKKMVLVGLWCIQTNPFDRPTMSKVVEMLEGSLEALQIPPKPRLCLPEVIVQNSVGVIQEASNFSKLSAR